MRGIQFATKSLFAILIFSSLILTLSGCLVENADPIPVTERTTDDLRIIKSGDQIVYRITGGQRTTAGVTTFSDATMTVTWTNDVIPNPIIGGTIAVLKEVTEIVFEKGGSSNTIRYVTQDQTTGSLFVHGYYDQNTSTVVYMGDDSTATPYIYQPLETVASPLTMAGSTFSYNIITDCQLTMDCATSIRAITETNQFMDNAAIIIDAGKNYNTLYYTYNGSFPVASPIALPLPLDYRRAFCGTFAVEFTGEYYYFPEVGLVRFQTSCTGIDPSTPGSFGHSFSGSLLSASFPLP